MHILLAHNRLYPQSGGIGTSLFFGGRELLELGHHVSVVTAESSFHHRGYKEYRGLDVFAHARSPVPLGDLVGLQALASKAGAISLRAQAARGPVDLVVARSLPYGSGIREALPDVPFLYFPPNPWRLILEGWIRSNGGAHPKAWLLRQAYRWAMGRGHEMERALVAGGSSQVAVASLSKVVAENLTSELDCRMVHIIPPGLDHETYRPVDQGIADVTLEALGIPLGPTRILYVGRLEAEKNPETLIRSFRGELAGLEAVLLIVGDGSQAGMLRSLAEGDPRIHFLGHHKETLPALYSSADVFVLPSLIEGFGQTLLEALACGTPCVAFRSHGTQVRTAAAEILDPIAYSRVVSPPNAAALAEGIVSVLDAPATRDEVRRACRDWVLATYSWRRFASGLLEALPHKRGAA